MNSLRAFGDNEGGFAEKSSSETAIPLEGDAPQGAAGEARESGR